MVKTEGESAPDIKIDVDGVTKAFGSRVAVDDLSFQIRSGEVVGFLGPNGAGKTTTMRLLTSFYTPDSGAIRIAGIDTQDQDVLTRSRIGYLPENNPLYEDLMVSEYLNFVADLRGLSGADRRRNIDQAVDQAGLGDVYYLPINQVSKGYHQRTGLAAAILHRPEILIMDEPTEGLDPNQRITIRDLIRTLGADRTVLLSTHVMQEVERTCDRIIIIGKGKVIADDPVGELSRRVKGSRTVLLEVEGNEVESALAKVPNVDAVKREEPVDGRNRFLITIGGTNDRRPEIFKLAKKRDWVLWELHEVEVRLEEVFHTLTVEQERPDSADEGPEDA